MAAATYDLYIEQGATFRFTMVYGRKDGTVDSDGNDVVVPHDITGCKLRLQVRQRRGSMVLIAATTENGGITIIDPTAGKIMITITDEASDNLTITKAKYDMEISYPSGDVYRILEGSVRISPNITQGADVDQIDTTMGDSYDFDEQDVGLDADALDQASTAY